MILLQNRVVMMKVINVLFQKRILRIEKMEVK
jgi:hypothetical protein